LLAVAAAAPDSGPDTPVHELELTREFLEQNKPSDADQDINAAFSSLDNKLNDLKKKIKVDQQQALQDDTAEGADPSLYASVADVVTSLPDRLPSSFLELGDSQTRAILDKPTAIVQTEQKLVALDKELKKQLANSHKWREQLKASSFIQDGQEKSFDEVESKLKAMQSQVRASMGKMVKASASFLQFDAPELMSSAKAQMYKLERMIKADAKKLSKSVPASMLEEKATPNNAAGLLQQMNSLAARAHKLANPPRFIQVSDADKTRHAHTLDVMSGAVEQLKQRASPASLAQLSTLEHNIAIARDILAGKRAVPDKLDQMLANIRKHDRQLEAKEEKFMIKNMPRDAPDPPFPRISLLDTDPKSATTPEEDVDQIEQKLKALQSTLKEKREKAARDQKKYSLAEIGGVSIPQAKATLESLLAKIEKFQQNYAKKGAIASSLLEQTEKETLAAGHKVQETDIKAFAKLDKLRAELKQSQASMKEARKMMPFAIDNINELVGNLRNDRAGTMNRADSI